MADIGTVLKQEIVRLARREIRSVVEPLRKIVAQQRKELAALKREVAATNSRVAPMLKSHKAPASTPLAPVSDRPLRFVAKGLKSLRIRLGISGPHLAALLGVSPQTIYNWEQRKSTPRPAQLAALAALRSAGKKDVAARVSALSSETAIEKK